ncbi:MFS transporter [Salmonella enterica]|nr:MFS transporter [Salmonella enterica]
MVLSDRKTNRNWTTFVAALSAAVMTLDITVVNVALPSMGQRLQTDLAHLQWVINGYTLSFAAFLLLSGSLSDRLGRRRIFIVGMVVFTVSSLACALSVHADILIIARIIQGIGGAMVFGTAPALIAGACEGEPPGVRTFSMGLFAAGSAFSAAVGPLIGGVLIQFASWSWLFAINVPIGVLIIIFTFKKVTEYPPDAPRHPLDLMGAFLITVALFCLNYSVITFPSVGSRNAVVYVTFIVGCITFVLFILNEWKRGDGALLNLRLFRIQAFLGAILLSFAGRVFSFGLMPFIIFWLSGMLGYSPLHIGSIFFIQSIIMVIAAIFSGVSGKRIQPRVLLAGGMLIVSSGLFVCSNIKPDSDWVSILPLIILMGIGTGMIMPHLMDLAVSVVPVKQAGMASGTANTFFPLGTSTGVAIFGFLLTQYLYYELPPEVLRLQGIVDPELLLQSLARGQISMLNGHSLLLAQARQAWSDALNLLFIIAGAASILAAAGSLWLLRPVK